MDFSFNSLSSSFPSLLLVVRLPQAFWIASTISTPSCNTAPKYLSFSPKFKRKSSLSHRRFGFHLVHDVFKVDWRIFQVVNLPTHRTGVSGFLSIIGGMSDFVHYSTVEVCVFHSVGLDTSVLQWAIELVYYKSCFSTEELVNAHLGIIRSSAHLVLKKPWNPLSVFHITEQTTLTTLRALAKTGLTTLETDQINNLMHSADYIITITKWNMVHSSN